MPRDKVIRAVFLFLFLPELAVLFSGNGYAASPAAPDIKAEQLNQVLHVRDVSAYTYPTKFGDLKFILSDGTPGMPAERLTLNDQTLLSTEGQTDAQGGGVSIMSELMTVTSTEYMPRRHGQTGHAEVKRMMVLLGGDGNCIKKFVILDFTGLKPFVSEKFGNNSSDQFCLTFKKAKWGKKESEIIINGPRSYIYYTLDKVTGPFVFE